jgi:hypothetical protein
MVSIGQEWDGGPGTSSPQYQSSNWYNGVMDDIRIWNTTRTPVQITQNMNTQLTGNESGLIAHYNCNQGTAGIDNTSELNLTNSSLINGLNANFNGFTLDGLTSNFITNPCPPCEPQYSSINVSACENYQWNQTTYTQSGTYTNTSLDINGCESIVTLNLIIDHPTISTQTITAVGSYTWIDGITYNSSNNTATHTYQSSKSGCKHAVILNLTIENTPVLNFNGQNDYITINPIATKLDGDNTFTIESWMQSQQGATGQALFAFNNTTDNKNVLLLMIRSNGALGVSDYGLWSDYTGQTIINDGYCHHIAYVRNGNTALTYVYGILQNTTLSITANYQISANDMVSIGQEWDLGPGTSSTNYISSNFFKGNLKGLEFGTQQEVYKT